MGYAEATAFFQVVNRRYDVGNPTVVTTNRGLPKVERHPRRPCGCGHDLRPADAPGDRVQHRRTVVANARTPGARDGDDVAGRPRKGTAANPTIADPGQGSPRLSMIADRENA